MTRISIKNERIVKFLFVMFSVFFLNATALGATFVGRWTGTWGSSYGETGSINATLVQNGLSLNGAMTVTNTDCGTFSNLPLTGTISNNVASFNAHATCPQDGSYNDIRYTQGVVASNVMTGNYQTYHNGSLYDSGTFRVTLQTLPTASIPASITVPASDVDGAYSVSWGASVNAGVTYLLEEATNNTFTIGKRTVYTGTLLTAAISGRTIGTTYYYRVKARKTGYIDSGWRTAMNPCIVKPTVGVPSIITVPVSDADGAFAVNWGASVTAGATYVVEEATNNTYTTGRRTVYAGTSRTISIVGRTLGNTYYYRVKARRTGYTDSGWRAAINPCIVQPTAGIPASMAVPASDPDGAYNISWGASATAGATYVVEEAANSAFTIGKRTAYAGALRTAAISGRTIGTTYYYRVKARKTGYIDSSWRTAISPCVVQPTTGVPASIMVLASDADGSYPISWGASATAGVTYVLEEATNSTFTIGKRTAYTGTARSAMINGRVSGNTFYYRVMATKTGYKNSAWRNGANGCFIGIRFRLPDTGQTQSYTNTFGEDSDYSFNPLSYTANGNGTVTDNNTGLVWQQQDDGQTRKWAAATAYCASLPLAGGGWRLPSKKELLGLVDYGKMFGTAELGPMIDPVFPVQGGRNIYWSSTPYVESLYGTWQVYFGNGSVYTAGYDDNYVRCVRGNQASVNNYTATNGTVTDHNTGLVWQQQDDGQARNWEEAIAYCEALSLANQNDWRLPNVKELESITDDRRRVPAIDPIFIGTSPSIYWSSTTDTYFLYHTRVVEVDFRQGMIYVFGDKSYSNPARCVRGGR